MSDTGRPAANEMTGRMTNDVSTEQAVATLLGERQRYEAWLGALEAKRANTPQHIYQRVHADYSARLQRVVEQLVTHRTAVQEMANELVDRLTSLDIDESKHRDERAEAEVRAAVGEITQEDCSQILGRTDGELERINAERTTITADLTRFRTLLDVGMQPLGAARPSAPSTTTMPSPPANASFDEMEFLNSVIQPRNGGAPAPAASSASPDLGVPAIEHGAGHSEHMPERGSAPVREMTLDVEHAHPEPSVNGHGSRAPVDEPRTLGGRETRDSVPSFMKDMPPEQVKTLKCQECGTLNYPTEWYCERCGAELAAL